MKDSNRKVTASNRKIKGSNRNVIGSKRKDIGSNRKVIGSFVEKMVLTIRNIAIICAFKNNLNKFL